MVQQPTVDAPPFPAVVEEKSVQIPWTKFLFLVLLIRAGHEKQRLQRYTETKRERDWENTGRKEEGGGGGVKIRRRADGVGVLRNV